MFSVPPVKPLVRARHLSLVLSISLIAASSAAARGPAPQRPLNTEAAAAKRRLSLGHVMPSVSHTLSAAKRFVSDRTLQLSVAVLSLAHTPARAEGWERTQRVASDAITAVADHPDMAGAIAVGAGARMIPKSPVARWGAAIAVLLGATAVGARDLADVTGASAAFPAVEAATHFVNEGIAWVRPPVRDYGGEIATAAVGAWAAAMIAAEGFFYKSYADKREVKKSRKRRRKRGRGSGQQSQD